MAQRYNYYLFGSPIAHSLSPLLHNTGFVYHKLNDQYSYSLCDTTSIDRVVEVLSQPDTAGGSVTIPHKQAIMPFIKHLSPAASAIDAVNTVWKDENGELHGDNTDWQAIAFLIQQRLSVNRDSSNKKLVGLVIGAGGTAHAACYALQNLGADLHIWNRSADRAERLAVRFGGKICTDISTLDHVDIIIGTVPPAASFEMPPKLMSSQPIVVELVYHPRNTALAEQARAVGSPLIEGVEILLEQGLRQFVIFSHGKEAPRDEIVQAFIEKYAGGSLKSNPPFSFK